MQSAINTEMYRKHESERRNRDTMNEKEETRLIEDIKKYFEEEMFLGGLFKIEISKSKLLYPPEQLEIKIYGEAVFIYSSNPTAPDIRKYEVAENHTVDTLRSWYIPPIRVMCGRLEQMIEHDKKTIQRRSKDLLSISIYNEVQTNKK